MTPQAFIAKWGAPDGIPGPAFALNEYAAELARVTVWIGELQWRMDHGYEFKTNPVLEPLDHIECRDALLCWPDVAISFEPGARAAQKPEPHTLRFLKSAPTSAPPTPLSDLAEREAENAADASASVQTEVVAEWGADPNSGQGRQSCQERPTDLGSDPHSAGQTSAASPEATWPKANVVIGNPPFLGGSKKSGELGNEYLGALNTVYGKLVPGFADLVCYWFAKALKAIETNGLDAAGLVSTNSIRGGANLKVLDAIVAHSKVFETWCYVRRNPRLTTP